jgi:probable F420-dependent oxidoreductase
MDFGFTLRPDHPVERVVALARQAEAVGFSHGWLDDSPGGRDIYPLLTLMAEATEHLRLGTCVTNPATRDITVTASVMATLAEISGGRVDLGLGRGDSGQRVLGQGPMAARPLDHAVPIMRDLAAGRKATYGDVELDLPWADGHELPVWIAGYEPIVLGMAGRAADGVILELADPSLVAWMAGLARAAAAEVGRDPAALRVQVAVPAHVGPSAEARERVHWFPQAVAGHVADVLDHFPTERLPASLHGYVHTDPVHDHGPEPGAPLPDEVVDRFAIAGPPQEHVRRLQELQTAGVDHFNLYLMSGDEEAQLEAYGREVIPALRETANPA